MEIKLWHLGALLTFLFALGTVFTVAIHNTWSEAADNLSMLGIVAACLTFILWMMTDD